MPPTPLPPPPSPVAYIPSISGTLGDAGVHRHKTEPIFQQLSIIQSTGKHITLHQVHLSTCIISKPQERLNKPFIILFIQHHTSNVQHQTSLYTCWGTLGESASHSSCSPQHINSQPAGLAAAAPSTHQLTACRFGCSCSLNTSTHSLQVWLQLLPQDGQVQCGSCLSPRALWDGLGDH